MLDAALDKHPADLSHLLSAAPDVVVPDLVEPLLVLPLDRLALAVDDRVRGHDAELSWLHTDDLDTIKFTDAFVTETTAGSGNSDTTFISFRNQHQSPLPNSSQ